MDNRLLQNRYGPIVTGTPRFIPQQTENTVKPQGQVFHDLLKEKLSQSTDINFSEHAVNRVMERNIDISESQITRLNEGVKLAEQKGLKDPLILIDKTAFIVNVKKNTVITTVQSDALEGNVFTNIDGTVII